MGMVIFLITAFRLFRQGDLPDRDERTKKLAAYGITYSWLFTLVLITVLYWIEFLNLADFTAEAILGILLFFMLISANVFRWFFMQKAMWNKDLRRIKGENKDQRVSGKA